MERVAAALFPAEWGAYQAIRKRGDGDQSRADRDTRDEAERALEAWHEMKATAKSRPVVPAAPTKLTETVSIAHRGISIRYREAPDWLRQHLRLGELTAVLQDASGQEFKIASTVWNSKSADTVFVSGCASTWPPGSPRIKGKVAVCEVELRHLLARGDARTAVGVAGKDRQPPAGRKLEELARSMFGPPEECRRSQTEMAKALQPVLAETGFKGRKGQEHMSLAHIRTLLSNAGYKGKPNRRAAVVAEDGSTGATRSATLREALAGTTADCPKRVSADDANPQGFRIS